MKEEFKILIQDFLWSIDYENKYNHPIQKIKPTFENFMLWLEDKTYQYK